MPPLHSLATSNSITFTSSGHFNCDQSSAGMYTSFQASAETPGLLECGDLIFFPLHASGNVKSNVCIAATFQLMKRGSIPPLHFRIFLPRHEPLRCEGQWRETSLPTTSSSSADIGYIGTAVAWTRKATLADSP